MIDKHLQQPIRIKVAGEAVALLEHGLLRVDRGDKLQVLNRLLRRHKGSAIVFGRTKHGVKKLNRDLKALGHDSVELQGNLSQGARDKTMESFRDQKADILVATNVAARGLDISHVGLVINFELPDTAQWMTHRIGRTAGWATRAGPSRWSPRRTCRTGASSAGRALPSCPSSTPITCSARAAGATSRATVGTWPAPTGPRRRRPGRPLPRRAGGAARGAEVALRRLR